MVILEVLVIATIIIAGAWVGYHAWQESLHNTSEKHDIEINIESVSTQKTIHNNVYVDFSKYMLVS